MTEMVKVTLFEAVLYDGAGWPPEDLAGAIEWMQAHMATIPEMFRGSAKFEIASESGYEGSHYPQIEMYYSRPETAEEEAERVAYRARVLAHDEARERQRYEALKAKFG